MIYTQARYFTANNGPSAIWGKFLQPILEAGPKKHIVQQLVKPIGLPNRPSIPYKPEGNSFRDMFDEEKTKRRVQVLQSEFSKSGMYDIHVFGQTSGKVFQAPTSYWRANVAQYFPYLEGVTLEDRRLARLDYRFYKECPATIMRIFSNDTGEKLTRTFLQTKGHDYYNRDRPTLPKGVGIVDINFSDNKIKSWVSKLARWNLRRLVPIKQRKHYYLCERSQWPFTLREKMLVGNAVTGYIFLIDSNSKIRWMAAGAASEDDVNTLWRSVNGILQENS